MGISPLQAQDESLPKTYYPNKGVIAATATFMPSFQLFNNFQNYYVDGFCEFFPSRRFSVRGDVMALAVSTSDDARRLLHNHRIVYGALYHIPIKNFDPYIGIQPGIALVQSSYNTTGGTTKSKVGVAPVLTAMLGARYFVGKFFNFFLEVRYAHSRHFAPDGIFKLDEISLAAGLGFNIDAAPKKD